MPNKYDRCPECHQIKNLGLQAALARVASQTPERRREIAIKASQAAKAKRDANK